MGQLILAQKAGVEMKTTEIGSETPLLPPPGTALVEALAATENGEDSSSKRFCEFVKPEFTLRLVEHFHRAKIAALREKE